MKPLRLTAIVPVAALTAFLTLATAGCAQPAGSSGSAGQADASRSSSTQSEPSQSAAGANAAGMCMLKPPAKLQITEADNGAKLCVAAGGQVDVLLHGTAADRWSPLDLTGAALAPTTSGKGTLAIGVTGGFYTAAAPGTVQLTSSRPTCPSGSSAGNGCVKTFTVSVTVR